MLFRSTVFFVGDKEDELWFILFEITLGVASLAPKGGGQIIILSATPKINIDFILTLV